MTQSSFERAGISTLTFKPYDWNALDYVLGAMKSRTPAVMEEIRDASGDDHERVVKSWAAKYFLDARLMVEYMVTQRKWWTTYPAYAKVLDFSGSSCTVLVVPPDRDDEWVKSHTDYSSLPNPTHETIQEWLERARALYDSRASLTPIKRKRKPRPRWSDFARHCDWLVQIQVQGLRPSEIARIERVDRAAVERGTRRIARLLGLQRREWTRAASEAVNVILRSSR